MLYELLKKNHNSDRRRGVPERGGQVGGFGSSWWWCKQRMALFSVANSGHLMRYQVYKCKVPVINKSRLKTLTSW